MVSRNIYYLEKIVSLLTAKGSFLILDEPLTDMDPASQELILELLEDYFLMG